MKLIYLLLLTCLINFTLKAQIQSENGIHQGINFKNNLCSYSTQVEIQHEAARVSIQKLRQVHKIRKTKPEDHVLLNWPVAQAINYNDAGFYGISNFVDHNSSYPNQISDYQCGTNSYDLSNGYNHKGIDIFSSPFAWFKMDQNQVIAVAATSGIIAFKEGANYDKNCEMGSQSAWNAVYVLHDDGSYAYYGHLKKNSLTNKNVGDAVETGEFLGVIGSSGSSTGPHLHFELYDIDDSLIDPFAGPCNPTTNDSWWVDQHPYKYPRLLKVMTNSTPPIPYGCYGEEFLNQESNFKLGNVIYLSSYLADQTEGTTVYHRILAPDGTVFSEWEQLFEVNYNSSYWYWTLTVSEAFELGEWTYEVQYRDLPPVTTKFNIIDQQAPVFNGPEVLEISVNSEYFTMDIENTGTTGLLIEEIESSDNIKISWNGYLSPTEVKSLSVQKLYKDDFSDTYIKVYHNGSNSPSLTQIIYEEQQQPLLQLSENTILFSELEINKKDSLALKVNNIGNATLELKDFNVNAPFFVNIDNLSISGNSIDSFYVYFNPTIVGAYAEQLFFNSNDSSQLSSSITLTGVAKEESVLSTSKQIKQLVFYPNPAKNWIYLQKNHFATDISLLQIRDLNGKVIIEENGSSTNTINISALNNGIYSIHLLDKKGNAYYQKLIKH